MIAAMCQLYRVSGSRQYLDAAKKADSFLRTNLCDGNTLFVSFRAGKRGQKGFLDDYAGYLFAQLALYGATLEEEYLDRAEHLCGKILADFQDSNAGGFYLYGAESERLILRPKETYDGAIPSGNSLMAWNRQATTKTGRLPSQRIPSCVCGGQPRSFRSEMERPLFISAGGIVVCHR